MDRAKIWPDFRAEDILFQDDDLIAVHKPAGVPSQAAQPDRPDDVVTRLRAHLGGLPLGVHQRLDRDTSGVMLFTKRSDMNAPLAKQFEARGIEKKYLAGVVGWRRGKKATLVDMLAPDEDGRIRVAQRGQRAVTHVAVRSTRGDRALLDLILETGRTHQARVQLANVGAAIAGDPIYRGAAAPRLLLHAASIGFEHPRTKKHVTVRDDRIAFDDWLARGDLGYGIYDDVAALKAALALAVERRWGLGRSADRDADERKTTAFRLVNEEGDALPGLAVDVYDAHLVAQLYASDEWDVAGRRERVLDALHALGFDGVYLKVRPKQANVLVDTRRDDLAPKLPVRGTPAASPLTIYEEGVPFAVRLDDGLSTGIFLDQRLNRRALREMSAKAKVANLFAYTCAFSIAAARGGATRTVSVDASLAALERGREGFEVAGLELGPAHAFAGEDAFAWLTRTAKKTDRFDVVILDPPSYSSTKKRRFVAESDYGELVGEAAGIVAPGGKIIACCNHRKLSRLKMRRLIHEGLRAAGRELVQMKDLPAAPDFPPPPGWDVHMKSVLITLK